MSHTHQVEGVSFIYNSDLSGDVEIINEAGDRLEVGGNALLTFVVCWLRDEAVGRLQSMDIDQLIERMF